MNEALKVFIGVASSPDVLPGTVISSLVGLAMTAAFYFWVRTDPLTSGNCRI